MRAENKTDRDFMTAEYQAGITAQAFIAGFRAEVGRFGGSTTACQKFRKR
jgi:hypothetical protein